MLNRTDVLADGVVLRLAALTDAEALATAYRENRDHLAPWNPRRGADFFTTAGQTARLRSQLDEYLAGRQVPWLLVDGARVVGVATLSGVTLGPFCSAYLGYWIAAGHLGRGLATAAVRRVCEAAAGELGLHRIEATTLVDNVRSQRVLAKCGFEHIGTAPRYLHINGEWRDHHMFQRVLHDAPPEL